MFFSSDHPDVHPTDVLEDADGSLIVVDTGGWYKVCCPTSQLAKPDVLGAIYRVRKVGAPKLTDPRGLKIAWAKQSPADLVKLLDDPRLYVQQRAIAELGRHGAKSAPSLTKVVGGKVSTTARQNAIWALTRITDDSARQPVRSAIYQQDDAVSLAAIHSAGLWRDAGALKPLRYALASDNGAKSRAAAEALGRIGDASVVPLLLGAAERLPQVKDADARRMLEHSIIYALIEIGDTAAIRAEWARVLPESRRKIVLATVGGANDTAAALWRAAFIAMDQIDGAALPPRGSRGVALLRAPDAARDGLLDRQPPAGGG